MATLTTAGAVPATPTQIQAQITATATTLAPGITTDLPGSMVEDMASTAAGAAVVQDQAFVDLVNSITPYNANPSILYALGAQYGIPQGVGSNTSVYTTFSGTPGFVINAGFVVSDGTYQYTVQDGGIIPTSGQSQPLYCLANVTGSWAVPEGTVTQIITSIPAGVTLTCTNTSTGVAGASSQSIASYQAQVIQAGQATAQGMPTFLKTQLQNVTGVQANLISVSPVGSNWKIICGGGDPYAVAGAIYEGLFDISNIVGSTLLAVSITSGYAAVVTTNLNHGYATGENVVFSGATGMTAINGVAYTALVLSQTTFSLNVPITSMTWSGGVVTVTTAAPHGLPTGTTAGKIYNVAPTAYNGSYTLTYVSSTSFTYPLATNPGAVTVQGYTPLDTQTFGTYGGNSATISPNLRNVTVSINDYPDTYNITFVNPPVQTVTLALTWNTLSTNYVSSVAVAQAAVPALATYINSIYVGQPINIYDLQTAFQNSVANILQISLISKMNFVVTINGITVSPSAGTGVIYGDPESYFEISQASISVTQG